MLFCHQLRLITSTAAYIVFGHVTCGACWDTPLWTEWQTRVKTQPSQTLFAGSKNTINTRMHSSKMHTVCNSSCLLSEGGGVSTPTPQSRHLPRANAAPWEQTPLEQAPPQSRPPGAGTPQSRHPPGSRPPCCKACWDTTCNACWNSTPPL